MKLGILHGTYWYVYIFDSRKKSGLRKVYICSSKKTNKSLDEYREKIKNYRFNRDLDKQIKVREKEIIIWKKQVKLKKN